MAQNNVTLLCKRNLLIVISNCSSLTELSIPAIWTTVELSWDEVLSFNSIATVDWTESICKRLWSTKMLRNEEIIRGHSFRRHSVDTLDYITARARHRQLCWIVNQWGRDVFPRKNWNLLTTWLCLIIQSANYANDCLFFFYFLVPQLSRFPRKMFWQIQTKKKR